MPLDSKFDINKLELGGLYSLANLADLQNIPAIKTAQSGVIPFQNCILLLLTLEKSKYRNRVDKDQLRMFFQESSTQESPAIKRFLSADREVLLFLRKKRLSQGKTMPYQYMGRLELKEIFGNKPVEITWCLIDFKNNEPR
jgi:hypothetical protein